jgi:RNA polymerase sigma-70 factor (ECF subfamily)
VNQPVAAAPALPKATEREFARLYAEQYPKVLAYLRRRCAERADAEDLAAETFRIAWQYTATSGVPTAPWLMVTARNTLANQVRARGRQAELARRVASEESRVATPGAAPASVTPGAASGADAASDATAAAMDAIGEVHREALALHYWDQLSGSECAALLGCSTGAFWVRLHRARAAFRAKYVEITEGQR